MSTGEDDPSSSLNARLRPRKPLFVSPPPPKAVRKSDGKSTPDRPKRTTTPSKAPPNTKQDDQPDKPDFSSTPQFLCPYCDKKFASKQTVAKHVRRVHFPASKQDSSIRCLFCNHSEVEADIIRHMVDSHPNQYFACLECHTRFPSTSELAEHKLNVCEKQKLPYRNKLRQKTPKKSKKPNIEVKPDDKEFQDAHGFNGIVISCELKPSHVHDEADIEDKITTNLILPPTKNLGHNPVIEKSAVIILDDIQWNKRIPPNFSFQNTDPDQILSRLGVVHRSPRTSEHTRKDWLKALDDCTQKFEKCFDTSFYSKVAGNVQENLSKFLDGSFNFNPDPDNVIKTRKPKNIINAVEGFPILLACEQYSRSLLDGYLPRAIAPKHKWKWDSLDIEKHLNPDQIRRDSHINNCIVTLVSNLDIWTQLCMRQKFEAKFNNTPPEKKAEKQNIISKELKEILESREIPTTSQVVVKQASRLLQHREGLDFPMSLGLAPAMPKYELQPAVLSGEWVRPRCYVCCACGSQTRDPKALSAHMANQHPNASVQHYEIVGEPLLNADILKHLYVPPSQISNRTRPLRGIRDCTKCNKSISLEDLHQHMLDCAGDTPTVRRRQCRQRPFGVRKRRPRLPDNTIRKKIRKDIRSRQRRQKTRMRPRQRPRPRSEVGDAETIRKMIADLPAKRHRVMVNPLNLLSRPRRKLEQRTKLIMKKRPPDVPNNRRRIRKEISDPPQVESDVAGEGPSKNTDDDEDNQPLRPKIKRIIPQRKNQHESFTRKTIMKRAKRRSVRVEQRKNAEAEPSPSEASASSEITEVSSEKVPQRIDVNRGAYNTREHSSRGGSGRGDDQRAECGGPNGNVNNNCPPAQNAPPLKHSIASLTANSETHDKSVQFHHSFLVQQECNNTNQHVPSGQHPLFENEAVVTKLDKPPLHCMKGPIDLNALQKNKLNKPRKGLNDCIAMLKNKLVDPVPCSGTTSHISVQCGTDEPIDAEPEIVKQLPTGIEATELSSVTLQIQTSPTNGSCAPQKHDRRSKSISIQPVDNYFQQVTAPIGETSSFRRRSTTHIEGEVKKLPITIKPDIEIIPMRSNSDRLNAATAQKPYRDISYFTVERVLNVDQSSKEKNTHDICLQSEMTPTIVACEKSPCISPNKSASQVLRNDNPHKSVHHAPAQILPDISPPCSSSSSRSERTSRRLRSNALPDSKPAYPDINYRDIHLEKIVRDVRQEMKSSNISPNTGPESKLRKAYADNCRDDYKKVNTECREEINSRDLRPNRKLSESYSDIKRIEVRSEVSSENKVAGVISNMRSETNVRGVCSDVSRKSTLTEVCPKFVQEKQADNPSRARLRDDTLVDLSSNMRAIHSEVSCNYSTRNVHSEFDLSEPIPLVSYVEAPVDTSSAIPQAHISTNVECIVPAPLDLSSKVSSVRESHDLLRDERYAVCDYDPYTTLDLSNKSTDSLQSALEESDTVVDLSVKPNDPERLSASLDLNVNTNLTEMIEDFITESDVDEPTDLSIHGRNNSTSFDFSRRITDDIDCVQDLSTRSTPRENENVSFLREEDISPTDLSSKTANKQGNIKDNMGEISKSPDMIVKADQLAYDIFDKKLSLQPVNYNAIEKNISLPQIVADAARQPKRSKKSQDKSFKTPPTRGTHKYALKLDYQPPPPPLKIPQFKTRSTTNTDKTASVEVATIKPMSKQVCSANNLGEDAQPKQVPLSYVATSSTLPTSPLNNVVGVGVGNPPVYVLPARTTATVTSSKLESTTPVYALANTCISVTKIEPSISVALASSLLSVPGTTIASTTPVYTLAGTTVATPENQASIIETEIKNNAPKRGYAPTSALSTTDTGIRGPDKELTEEEKVKLISDMMKSLVPEIARKVAKLPEHISLILARMPEDHRNQLLYLLPQCFDLNDSGDSSLEIATSKYAACLSNMACSVATPQPISLSPSTSEKQFALSTAAPLLQSAINTSRPVDYSENTKTVKTETGITDTNSTDSSSDPVASKTQPLECESVIDLTEDENLLLLTNAATQDLPQSVQLPDKEQPNLPVIPKPPRQKSNNDQTASLRAVRIKAPSERQKESRLLKKVSEEQKPLLAEINIKETEVNKSLVLSSAPLAIQQAEVSSTQQSSQNVLTDSKLTVNIPHSESTSSVKSGSQAQCSPGVSSVKNEIVVLTESNKSSTINSDACDSAQPPLKVQTLENQIKSNDQMSEIEMYGITQSPKPCPRIVESIVDSGISTFNKEIVLEKSLSNNLDSQPLAEINETNLVKMKTYTDGCKNHNSDNEDSEDDVSLAIIVKKKQRDEQIPETENKKGSENNHDSRDDLVNSEINHENPPNKRSSKISSSRRKKKEKKSNKVSDSKKSRDLNIQEEKVENLIAFTEQIKEDLIDTNDGESSGTKTDENKNSKKKLKKTIPQNFADEEEQQQQPDKDKNKENYTDTESTAPETGLEVDKSVQVLDSELIRSQSALNEASVRTINSSEGTVLVPGDTDKKANDMAVRSESSEVTLRATSTENSVAEKEMLSSSSKVIHKNEAEERVQYVAVSLNCKKQVESSSNISEEISHQPVVETNTASIVSPKDTDSSLILSINDLPSILADDSTFSLRRSRRGKSFLVEDKSCDIDSTPNRENLTEKALLTKKQLIFSKLLLDEENHYKSPNDKTNKVSDISNDDVRPESRPDTIKISSKSSKTKSVKRKQSPQQKRKFKKKRSIDLGICSDEKLDTNIVGQPEEMVSSQLDATQNTEKLKTVNCETTEMGECGMDVTNEDLNNKTEEVNVNPNKAGHIEVENRLSKDKGSEKGTDTPHITKLSSAEKRKLATSACSDDFTIRPKPKKSKLNKNIGNQKLNSKTTTFSSDETILKNESTSYKAFAARKTRSKSVNVKSSSSDLYDPYDIDLDEMIEKTEPYRKTISKNKERHCALKPDIASTKQVLENSSDILSESVAMDTVTSISDNERKISENETKLHTLNKDEHSETDSDDSSRSDVPLKRYVEEKGKKSESVKKSSKSRNHDTSLIKDTEIISDDIKEKTSVADNSENISRETDEQLRSEQFMESFGFFSERKPRKSNLLASKKISETFHIIANESDDIYFGYKEKNSKKRQNEARKSVEAETTDSQTKKHVKRGRKKKVSCTATEAETNKCDVCQRTFGRPDNYQRHIMTMYHVSRVCEVELGVKCSTPFIEEPNYLIPLKQQIDHVRWLKQKIASHDLGRKVKIPDLRNILLNVQKVMKEQQHQRELSGDEALFLDCCELLKKNDPTNPDGAPSASEVLLKSVPHCTLSTLQPTNKLTYEMLSNSGVDPVAIQAMIEDEEVLNLEKELFSGLKQACDANMHNIQPRLSVSFEQQLQDMPSTSDITINTNDFNREGNTPRLNDTRIESEDFESPHEYLDNKYKKYHEVKEKMYPDIEEIDMFEDKFDKIKRKCRSQAAAAKQPQPSVEPCTGQKVHKKFDKKKGKKSSKKFNQTVLTKGALKGFDGVKVSIPTSNINVSAIVPPKKKKKSCPKKRREKKDSLSISKDDCDTKPKDSGSSQKKVDVYEFMDNEDAELFEFRPSTLMERFKSLSNKESEKGKGIKGEISTSSKSAVNSAEAKKAKDREKSNKREEKIDREQDVEIKKAIDSKDMIKGKGTVKGKELSKSKEAKNRGVVISKGSLDKGKKNDNEKHKPANKEDFTRVQTIEHGDFKSEITTECKQEASTDEWDATKKVSKIENKCNRNNTTRSTEKATNILNGSKTTTENSNVDIENANESGISYDNEKANESASDVDDFVYMSDYMCSDEETENSFMFSNVKLDAKKSTQKKKDIGEKNAVMGKIFKHNAVRSGKRSTKTNEAVKPKANLDQLFDSLLEDEPNSSMLTDRDSSKDEKFEGEKLAADTCKTFLSPPKSPDQTSLNDEAFASSPKEFTSHSLERPTKRRTSKTATKYDPPKNTDSGLISDYGPSTSKEYDFIENDDIYRPSISTKSGRPSIKDSSMPKRQDNTRDSDNSDLEDSLSKDDDITKGFDGKELSEPADVYDGSLLDEAGVARQRARRKCTVGKQNVLAETWSSESEPDSVPPRPNSAESVVAGAGRKKRGRKRDGQHSSGRRGSKQMTRKIEIESRVSSGSRSVLGSGVRTGGGSGPIPRVAVDPVVPAAAPPAGSSGWRQQRRRSATYYWSSDCEEEQEPFQQHGWIVGDSHKKLVTMLAHAKGRKRHSDEKRHCLE